MTHPSDFFTWLSSQVERDDFIGDFARDAVEDPSYPRGVNDYRRIGETLNLTVRGCRGARLGLARGFREWMRGRRREGFRTLFAGRLQGLRRLQK